jgi:hypothetical protein
MVVLACERGCIVSEGSFHSRAPFHVLCCCLVALSTLQRSNDM